ncbi:MAG TPA: hypothetical protein VL122_00660 [Nitrospirota bacterium]|nr:hypothetical protein [Nitrospirota bacterium]
MTIVVVGQGTGSKGTALSKAEKMGIDLWMFSRASSGMASQMGNGDDATIFTNMVLQRGMTQ